MKILVVEDERLISLALTRMISSLGHAILACVPSAESAIATMEKERPGLVLMDIRLEGKMDGIDAARLIRERWGTPLAYTSAYTDPDTRSRAESTGPVAFLAKPIAISSLKSLLESLAASGLAGN